MLVVWWGLTLSLWIWGYGAYILAVIRRQISPSVGFWLTIAAVDWVLITVQIAAGVLWLELLQTTIWVVGATATAVIAGIYRRKLSLNRSEQVCLGLATIGMLLWLLCDLPELAVIVMALTIGVCSIPLWQNALRGKERWQPFAICLAASACNLGTLPQWQMAAWPGLLVPLVAVVYNAVSVATAICGRRGHAGCNFPDTC